MEVTDPGNVTGPRVERHEQAAEARVIDVGVGVCGAGDVGRRPVRMALGDVTPEDLAVAQSQRLGVGVLVDQVGDAAVDRGRELDQRVGVEGPGDHERRPQILERLGQVLVRCGVRPKSGQSVSATSAGLRAGGVDGAEAEVAAAGSGFASVEFVGPPEPHPVRSSPTIVVATSADPHQFDLGVDGRLLESAAPMKDSGCCSSDRPISKGRADVTEAEHCPGPRRLGRRVVLGRRHPRPAGQGLQGHRTAVPGDLDRGRRRAPAPGPRPPGRADRGRRPLLRARSSPRSARTRRTSSRRSTSPPSASMRAKVSARCSAPALRRPPSPTWKTTSRASPGCPRMTSSATSPPTSTRPRRASCTRPSSRSR